jgi:hypothetical protein
VLRPLTWTLASLLMIGSNFADDEAGFTPLFDGRSLGGWTRFGGNDATWSVADGLLVCSGVGGGWLGTDRDHASFVLRLEFRMTEGSNSGVYLRAPADRSHISRTGLEIQLLDELAPKHAHIQPWQRTGAVYHVAAPLPGHQKPPGEWNAMEIKLDGPRAAIVLNGTTIVEDRLDRHPELEAEHPGLKRTTGRIGLQCHNGRVEFRNLRIRPL